MKLSQSFTAGQYQQQKQTQKLAMTQQLQQSIQVLAYNNEELQNFIADKALENPFLELNNNEYQNTSNHILDSDQVQSYLEQLPDKYESLYSYLEEQIFLNYRQTKIRDVMIYLLDYIDQNGYLNIDLEDLTTTEIDQIMLMDALALIQQLEPAGVGARNLQECLLLQIERDNTSPNLAYVILEEEFDNFVNHKWDVIAKKYQIELIDLQDISDYLLTLTPHPGNFISDLHIQNIIPELTVKKENDQLLITYNKYGQPQVTLEYEYYQDIINSNDNSAIKFAKEKRNEIVWIQKSLQQRQETIYQVGEAIINKQIDFFTDDKHPLKPLKLSDIAKELNIHESTVSRSINGKYLETWFGVFELKSFFAKKAANSTDDSTTHDIKNEIKKIINNEDKTKPYSDQKIADLLKETNHNISRRTVAKYREELEIPSSTKRKRYN